MTLGEKQELFAELQAEWVLWVTAHKGWKLREGEGRILILGADGKTGRRARIVGTDKIVFVQDLVHLPNGAHPNGLGKDWQLFVDGEYITSGDHPVWQEIGPRWESMNTLCRWGGRFRDGNHISLEHGGMR
jgi:hypothetical protein